MGQIWFLSTKYKHNFSHNTENTRTYVRMVTISGDFNLDVVQLVIAHCRSVSSCQAKECKCNVPLQAHILSPSSLNSFYTQRGKRQRLLALRLSVNAFTTCTPMTDEWICRTDGLMSDKWKIQVLHQKAVAFPLPKRQIPRTRRVTA
jgi:hypothetical protein